jgi:hypothetical protein
MTPEYRARRAEKHLAQAAAKVVPESHPVHGSRMTIDLTPKTPRLAWVGGKSFKNSTGNRKNAPQHGPEQTQAWRDNKNPYLNKEDDKWYYYDETEQSCEFGFVTREQAETALNAYGEWLNSPKEAMAEGLEAIKQLSKNPAIVAELAERGLKFDTEEIERSIGGISENLGLSGDNAEPVSN